MSCAAAAGGEPHLLGLVEVDVRHLAGGMDAGVGAPGDHEPRVAAEDARERVLERPLHGAQPGLARPAAEVRAVIGDIEPDAHRPSLLPGPFRRRAAPPPG